MVHAFALVKTPLADVLVWETPYHDVTSTTASYWVRASAGGHDWLLETLASSVAGARQIKHTLNTEIEFF